MVRFDAGKGYPIARDGGVTLLQEEVESGVLLFEDADELATFTLHFLLIWGFILADEEAHAFSSSQSGKEFSQIASVPEELKGFLNSPSGKTASALELDREVPCETGSLQLVVVLLDLEVVEKSS